MTPVSADAPMAGFFVVALGKMGAFELNYSSDIDISIFYEPEALPLRPGEQPEKPVGRVVVAGQLHMRPGDVCEVEVDGLGVLSNPVIEDPTPLR